MITKIDEDTLKVNDVNKLIETLDELRPTAREMFKVLGYGITNKVECHLGDYLFFYNVETEQRIDFQLEDKKIYIDDGGDYERQFNIVGLTLDELSAINKQVEELRVVGYGI